MLQDKSRSSEFHDSVLWEEVGDYLVRGQGERVLIDRVVESFADGLVEEQLQFRWEVECEAGYYGPSVFLHSARVALDAGGVLARVGVFGYDSDCA